MILTFKRPGKRTPHGARLRGLKKVRLSPTPHLSFPLSFISISQKHTHTQILSQTPFSNLHQNDTKITFSEPLRAEEQEYQQHYHHLHLVLSRFAFVRKYLKLLDLLILMFVLMIGSLYNLVMSKYKKKT
jgi:hypothetical protein